MRPVQIVTDSAVSLAEGEAAAAGVVVVPLRVAIDGKEFSEDDLTPHQIVSALQTGSTVSTAQPSVEAFAMVYARAAAAGAAAVVSVHMSAALSGTYTAACAAAADATLPVHVVDSASVGFGLGFAVRAAVAARDRGEDPAAAARASNAQTDVWFYVDTLEHLRRGGRIGAAAAVLGTALAIKPILGLIDGQIVPAEKVRTRARAVARLEELGVQRSGDAVVELAVQHLGAAEAAAELADRLAKQVPGARRVDVVEIGAAVGAHVGPGLLAVALRRL
ncbi:MAG TPA: DegV family protein [Sporichthyaceae bacterium]